MGIVGALVIASWSRGPIRDADGVLVDYVPAEEGLSEAIRAAVAAPGETITDPHVSRLGPGYHGAIVGTALAAPQAPSHYRAKLAHLHELSHVTVEVEPKAA